MPFVAVMTGEGKIKKELYDFFFHLNLPVSLSTQVFDVAIRIKDKPYAIELKMPFVCKRYWGFSLKGVHFGKDQAERQEEISKVWNIVPVLIIYDHGKFFVIENYIKKVKEFQNEHGGRDIIPLEVFDNLIPLGKWLRSI